MWLIEQAKKLVKKWSRLKLNTIDKKNDENHELIANKSYCKKIRSFWKIKWLLRHRMQKTFSFN
jgi:hypothetical protein